MTNVIQALQTGNGVTLHYPGLYAAKIGPFPMPVRIKARAYTDHHLGGGSSTAWMKLYYDETLIGEASGNGDPIALQVLYEVGLVGGAIAAFRLETGNHISTVQDLGFDLELTLL